MRAQVNAVLDEIREKLEGEWATQEEIEGHADSEGGEGGAENVSDIEDKFNAFMNDVVDAVLDRYDVKDDDAIALVFDVIDSAVEDEELPDFPDDDASEQEVGVFLGAAQALGLKGMVLQAAKDAW